MASIPNWDLKQIKKELRLAHYKCSQRGLLQSTKWAAELCFALVKVDDKSEKPVTEECDNLIEWDQYVLAKSYFDLREYDRAAHFTTDCKNPQSKFLHWYSRYLSGEKKKLDDAVDSIAPSEKAKNTVLRTLRSDLQQEYTKKNLDGYCLYLYGVVLKRLELNNVALEVLLEAVHAEPIHWGAWLELSSLISDREALNNLSLPSHWMVEFFQAHTCLELQLNEEALETYLSLREHGFLSSTYIMAQVAIAYHNMRDVDVAIEGFQVLQKADPCRLDNMDIFSNLLYVKELRVELSYLAHHTCEIDKYRVETCCVIGNFYSLRSQHEKAVLYFQRALRLNPNYLSAWTLMGHEYMEMKNTSAAIQSYRQAIEVNQRDYRAWYGLGQTYEILKMPFYCLYYYRQAQQLRPNDSRMMVALGEAYEKLEKLSEAQRCFWRAHNVGDVEGMALIKLAKLYEKLGQEEQAAATYTDYIAEAEMKGIQDRDEQHHAYRYLANHWIKRDNFDLAYPNAQKCTEYPETKEEGKVLLRQIAVGRANQEKNEAKAEESAAMEVTPSVGSTMAEVVLSPMNLSFSS